MQDRLQPALLGGVLIGVLAALPVVNCCCCVWMIAGGVLAAYLRQQPLPYQLAAAEGALVGLMAGVVGAVISTVLSIPIQMTVGPMMQAWIERLMAGNPDVPPELRDAVGRTSFGPGRWIVGLVFALIVYPLFALVGGLLGTVMFKKNLPPPPPPGTIDVPPPTGV
jgi:hypothetical protein